MGPEENLAKSLADGLHADVAAMNRDNFIVRGHLEAVNRFRDRAAWENLDKVKRDQLENEVASLPSQARHRGTGQEPCPVGGE